MMLDSSQLSTKRLNQSMTATKYRKPPRIGMSVICMRQANPIYTVGGVGECSDGVDEQAQVVSVGRRRSRGETEQLVAKYEASGLSRTDFCRQRGLSLATLARYRKRQAQANAARGVRWMEVNSPGRISNRATGSSSTRTRPSVRLYFIFDSARYGTARSAMIRPTLARDTPSFWLMSHWLRPC